MDTVCIVIGTALLVANLVWLAFILCKLKTLGENWKLISDRSSAVDTRLNKIETAVEWWLQKEGMRLDRSPSMWRWYVTTTDDGTLRDWLTRTEERKREALADALYKASIQAMRDFENETKKANKK